MERLAGDLRAGRAICGRRPRAAGVSVFTAILRAGLPDTETHIVHRGAEVFAILNAFPYAVGHLLVLPYREVERTRGPDRQRDARAVGDGCRRGARAEGRDAARSGINVGLNLGRPAGGSVSEHLHVHVVPRGSATPTS